MRGEVLHYDEGQGFGFISGADGSPYTFRREDLRRVTPISKGMAVEFEGSGGQARGVYPVRDRDDVDPPAAQPAAPWGAAAPTPGSAQQFGRAGNLDNAPSTGLWNYFWGCLTANYVNFRSRARRKEYWGYLLFWLIGLCAALGLGLFLDEGAGRLMSDIPIATGSILGLYILATFLPSLAVTVRRIHDIGLSGWFYLLVLVPYVGTLIIIVFALIPTQTNANKWGPVPAGIRIPPPFTPPAT